MITFFVVLALIIGIMVLFIKLELSSSYGSPGYALVSVILGFILAGILLTWATCYYDSINTVLDAKSRMETVASYKYKEGVYLLNMNTVTQEELKFALKYNSWLKTAQYWNKKPFFDAFKTDMVNDEKPIRFIEEEK